MDYSKLSDSDLLALKNKDYSALSNEALLLLKNKAKEPQAKKGIDLTPSGLYKNVLASTLAAPARMALKGEDYQTARNNALAAAEKNKPAGGFGDFIVDLGVYSQIPVLKGGGIAKALGNAVLQGGVPGAIETLKRGGNVAGGTAMGTGIAAVLPPALKGIGAGIGKVSPQIGFLANKALEGITGLKPQTIRQAIKPNSQALDLSEEQAQNLLMNTTERVRNNYKSLLNDKGNTVGNLLKELPEDKTFKAEELSNLYDSILNNFSLSKNQAINPARNATSKELSKIQDLIYGNENGVVNPKELYDINKNINNMIDWDKPAAALKNDVLEQMYLANAKKISDISPNLKIANKAYADLMDFQKNEGIRRILNNQNNIDTASSALRNYNSTVTKGNTNRNIQDLEKILTDNGYMPFLNDIDDVNAAMNILEQTKTGKNVGGNETIAKGLANIAFKGIRKLNRTEIPKKVNEIKELLSPLGIAAKKISAKTSKGMGAKAGANMLYGGVEYNDYQ